MNRWVHALLAVLVLTVLVAAFILWPAPDRGSDSPAPAPTPAPAPSDLPPPTGPTTPACPPVASARLRVATFNIHGGVRGKDDYDLRGIAEEIRSWKPDVVLLQEVYRFRARSGLEDQPAELSRLLGMEVVFGNNVTKPPEADGAPRREYGTAILSSRPIVRWSNRPLPNLPGLQRRGLLRATIQLAGRRIDVYNTHLQHTRGVIRILQNRAIRRHVARAPRPFLLGGDFNADPGSPAMRVLDGVVRDPWPAVGTGQGLTAPPWVPRRRIDYLLHGLEGWVPEQAQVLRSDISDHRAVLVDYALPRRAC